ncbi:hypothetical protein HLH58_08725 [Providencia stuartii]|nr:hypothetical protein [Providencia stuartii]NPD94960.1 hypothetical protein [Providencia stuartii]
MNKTRCVWCNKKLNKEELFYYECSCEKCEYYRVALNNKNKFDIFALRIAFYFRRVINLV